VIAAILALVVTAVGADEPTRARRLLALLAGVAAEYGEAFADDGTLARPIELDEAALLVDDARREAEGLPSDVDRRLAALGEAIAARAPSAAVTERVQAIRLAVEDATGVAEDVMPPARPSPARGEAIYRANCVRCHGERGAGDGPDAATLERKPRDFTDAEFMQGETPADFFRVVSLGRRRAAMPAWEDVLSVQERWDVVSYLWSLPADVRPALAEVRRRLDAALTAHRLGERTADELATDAYLAFEPLEARLDAAAVGEVERAFLRFRTALRQTPGAREVDAAAAAVRAAVDRAESPSPVDVRWVAGGAAVALLAFLPFRRVGSAATVPSCRNRRAQYWSHIPDVLSFRSWRTRAAPAVAPSRPARRKRRRSGAAAPSGCTWPMAASICSLSASRRRWICRPLMPMPATWRRTSAARS